MSQNSSIIVCGQKFDVGRKVITFEDDPSISAYTPHCISKPGIFPTQPAKGLGQNAMRYRGRRLIGADRSLSRLQQVLKQFVVHHDGMGTSKDCFRVLHDERGLSVHFLIDNNGDIYQTLDLVECGFQAAGVNETSIGVELCNRGDAMTFPEFYHGKRDKVTCTINTHQWLAFEFTKDQYDAMAALGRTLARVLPGLPQVCPQGGDGEPLWATVGDAREFAGYMGHYHVTNQKWDPGPWDFKKFVQSIRGRMFFPALVGSDKSELPDDPAKVEELAGELYANNEKEGEGGYFPVGPMGETRLWHGGIHLRQERGKPVVAPFAGKIVAARMKGEDDWPPVGSSNFVLLRHEMSVGGAQIKFYTLFMHVDAEADPAKQPNWMKGGAKKKWWTEFKNGDVAQMEESISAGEVVAHFGEAGKPGNWQGQIHFAIFSTEEIGEKVDPGFWKIYDGTAGGRFCQVPQIIGPIDVNKSQTLAHSEVVNFFHNNPARVEFHKIAVRHVSEWGDNNDFEASLNRARDFGGLSKPLKHKLYTEQIEPFLWWTEGMDQAGLPDDKVIWSYHPITFITWLNTKMKGAPQKAKGLEAESSWNGKKPPVEIKDDASEGAEGFLDDEDALFGEAAKHLDLEKLAGGFPD